MQQDREAMVQIEKGIVDAARRKAPRTLPGLVLGGIVGALLGGPVGAFVGGMIGGGIGLSADLEEENNKGQK